MERKKEEEKAKGKIHIERMYVLINVILFVILMRGCVVIIISIEIVFVCMYLEMRGLDTHK